MTIVKFRHVRLENINKLNMLKIISYVFWIVLQAIAIVGAVEIFELL